MIGVYVCPLCPCVRVSYLYADTRIVHVCVFVWLPAVSYLILTDEFLVGDMGWQIRVQEGTEGQAVTPTAAEVSHVDILQKRGGRDEAGKSQTSQSQHQTEHELHVTSSEREGE